MHEIIEKAQITEEQFNSLMGMLFKKINIVPDIEIQAKMEEAKKAMDKIDPKDTPFIAAALSMQFDVWSSLLTPFCCSISNFKINRRPLCNPNIAVLLSPLTYILAL